MLEKEYQKKVKKIGIDLLDEIDRICTEKDICYFLVGGTLLGAVRHKGFIPWDDDIDIGMPRKDYNKFIKEAPKLLKDNYIIDTYKTNSQYWLPFSKVRDAQTKYMEQYLTKYNGPQGIWIDIFPIDNCDKECTKSLLFREKVSKKIKDVLIIRNIEKYKENDTFLKRVIKNIIIIIPNFFWHKLLDFCMSSTNNKNNRFFVNFGSQYGLKKQTHLKEKYFPLTKIEFEGKLYNAPRDYDYVLKKIYGDKYMELPPIEKRVTHNPVKIIFEDGEEICFDK